MAERLRNGESAAFEAIFNRYRGRLYNFIRKNIPQNDDASEIVQETFARLWAYRQNIDPAQSLDALIYTIAKNELFGHLRKMLRRRKYAEEISSEYNSAANTTDLHVEYRELRQILTTIINNMPPKRREIFLLSREQGLSYRQIAEQKGISENTVDTQIRKALACLKEELRRKMVLPIIFLFL